jgi:hypothetical protein
MKKLMFILLISNVNFLYSQEPCDWYCLNFEDSQCLEQLFIDTVNFPENLWQIGKPQKPSFDNAHSGLNVIITDTLHSYTVSNQSVFTIWNPATDGDIYGMRMFTGNFNVQSDSLNDYGLMEFSPDNGTTWIDMIYDTIYSSSLYWYSPKPVLTGNSYGWKCFAVAMGDIGSIFNIELGDTLLYRFTFISDDIPDDLGGLMYDDLCFYEFVEGITETHFKPLKTTIFPNPSGNLFTIEFENSMAETYELAVYNSLSKLVLVNDHVTSNQIIINAKSLEPGVYYYKLTKIKEPIRGWGKFITSK